MTDPGECDRAECATCRANLERCLKLLAQREIERLREPHWLTKDFNVLFRVTRDLLRAVGTADESKVAQALNEAARQIGRLAPAFAGTEISRRLAGMSRADVETAIVAQQMARAAEGNRSWRPCCSQCGAESIALESGAYRCSACRAPWDGSEVLPDGSLS